MADDIVEVPCGGGRWGLQIRWQRGAALVAGCGCRLVAADVQSGVSGLSVPLVARCGVPLDGWTLVD